MRGINLLDEHEDAALFGESGVMWLEYDPERNKFRDEMGQIIYWINRIITPAQLMLFRHYKCNYVFRDITNSYLVQLVYPDESWKEIKKMNNTEKLGIVGIIIGAASIGYSYYIHRKVDKTNDIIEKSVDEISKNMNITVSDEMINRALDKAVNKEVIKAVNTVSYDITENMRRDIRGQVKTAVADSYTNIRESVSKEVSRNVATLDMELLKKQVREDAKKAVLDKFDDNLDSLLKDFNQNLNNAYNMYSKMADSMVKSQQETIFRINI